MIKQAFIVEQASISDARELASVQLKCWYETNVQKLRLLSERELQDLYGSEEKLTNTWLKRLERVRQDSTNRLVLVSKVEGKIVGYSYICQRKLMDHLALKRLYILNEFQGIGIGSALMQEMLKWAGDRRPITLLVGLTNKRAQAVYEHYGFRNTGEIHESKIMKSVRMILNE